jgi:hypothetical protein
MQSYRSDQTRGQANIVCQRWLVDAVCAALGGLDQLAWLFADDVGMLHDTSVTMSRPRGLQPYQGSVMGCILLSAQNNDVAFCEAVRKSSVAAAGLLPWNARLRAELLAKLLAVGARRMAECRIVLQIWFRITSGMSLSISTVQCRRDAPPQSEAVPRV